MHKSTKLVRGTAGKHMRHLQIQIFFTTKLPCRIKCKFLAMTSKVFHNSAPAYLSSLTFTTLLTLPSEKAMAPHSSTLAWKIPWAEEPGGLQSMQSRRVGHD